MKKYFNRICHLEQLEDSISIITLDGNTLDTNMVTLMIHVHALLLNQAFFFFFVIAP